MGRGQGSISSAHFFFLFKVECRESVERCVGMWMAIRVGFEYGGGRAIGRDGDGTKGKGDGMRS